MSCVMLTVLAHLEAARRGAEVWLDPSLYRFFRTEKMPLSLSLSMPFSGIWNILQTVCSSHILNRYSLNNFPADLYKFELRNHPQSRYRAVCPHTGVSAAAPLAPGAGPRPSFSISEVAVDVPVLLWASVCLPVDSVCTNVPTSKCSLHFCFHRVPTGAMTCVRSLPPGGPGAALTTADRTVSCGVVIYINFICTVTSLLYVR